MCVCVCVWNVVSLHYVIIVKIKKFESVERECDDLDVGPHAMIVLLILTIAFRSCNNGNTIVAGERKAIVSISNTIIA